MGVYDTKLNTSIVEGHDLAQISSHMNKIVNINFQCKARPTALHTVVIHNNVEVAALLLERGADMMIAPLKKCVKNESECALLTAFKQADSHEDGGERNFFLEIQKQIYFIFFFFFIVSSFSPVLLA